MSKEQPGETRPDNHNRRMPMSTNSTPPKSPVSGAPAQITDCVNRVFAWRSELMMDGQFTATIQTLKKVSPEQRTLTEACLRLLNRRSDVATATTIKPDFLQQVMDGGTGSRQARSAAGNLTDVSTGGYLLLSGAMTTLDDQVIDTVNGILADTTLPRAQRGQVRDTWAEVNLFANQTAQKSQATKQRHQDKAKALSKATQTATQAAQTAKAMRQLHADAGKDVVPPPPPLPGAGK
jgi:hypothetical protein